MEYVDHFKCTQSKISHQNRYGSESLYWNQAGLGLCEQNRHIVNAKLCVQGLAHISKNKLVGKEYSPHFCAPIQYGQKFQYAEPLDASEYLSDKETNLIQQVCRTLLYYAIAINNTILPALC